MSHFKTHTGGVKEIKGQNYYEVELIQQHQGGFPDAVTPPITIRVSTASGQALLNGNINKWFELDPGYNGNSTQIYDLIDFTDTPHQGEGLLYRIFIGIGVAIALLAILFNWRKRGSTKEGDQKK